MTFAKNPTRRLLQLAIKHSDLYAVRTRHLCLTPCLTHLSCRGVSDMPTARDSSCNITKRLQTGAAHIDDPYSYTAGKWLVNDALQQNALRVSFDYDALCAKVLSHSPDASCIDGVEKQAGMSHRSFVFSLDNGKKLVARLPTSTAGPARFMTSSQVATVTFLQRTTKIPIPQILDWSDDPNNDIGSEFVIMEPVKGIELRKIWFDLEIGDQIKCIWEIMKQVGETSRLEFPAYGSLYFQNAASSLGFNYIPLDDEFCIGPHCGWKYWDFTPSEKRYYERVLHDPGPWKDLPSFVSGLIDAGLSRLPTNLEQEKQNPCATRPYQRSVNEHLELLQAAREVLLSVINVSSIRDNASPTLLHPKLNMTNIFVDPTDATKITSITGWHSTSIEPAVLTQLPVLDFVIPPELRERYEEREAEGKQTEEHYWDATVDVCMWANDRLSPLRDIDYDILRPFSFCHNTWKNNLPAAARALTMLLGRWEALDLPGKPPCNGTTLAKLQALGKDFDLWTDVEKFSMELDARLRAQDGWVPIELWEQAQEVHRNNYKAALQLCNEPDSDMTPDQLKAIWPFDLPC